LLIDGSSMIFRAYYGVRDAPPAPDGRQVNAVHGFFDRLARLIAQRRPRHLAVADDAAWRPDWRVDLVPTYKSHRVAEPIPPGLAPQMPIIRDLLAAIGIDMVGVADHEAEDVIATWSRLAPGTLAVGTWRGGFGKDFAVVHGHGPGVVVEVAGEEYARLLVSMADAEVIATHLATVATTG